MKLKQIFARLVSGVSLIAILGSSSVAFSQEIIDGGSTVTVPGSQSSPWNVGTYLIIGNTGTGTLEISNGGIVSSIDGSHIGFLSGSTGTVSVSGAGSAWNNSGQLLIGESGTGTLTITNGGSLSTVDGFLGFEADGVGNVTVSGANSIWINSGNLEVGRSGAGSLTISNGGSVSNADGLIGGRVGSVSSVTVSGANSVWNNSLRLRVGLSGSGTLTITNGGAVSTTTNGYIGYNDGATGGVSVDGTGSHWSIVGNLYVGGSENSTTAGGSGTLTITNGGTVSNAYAEIAMSPTGTREVTVSGTGSQWLNTNAIHVGLYGNATLDILDGGYVSSLNARIGGNSFGDGTGTTGITAVSGSGSQWINTGYVYIGSDGNHGILNISTGGYVSNTAAFIGSDAGSTGAVTVSGTGSQWINSGNLAVGATSNGTLEITAGGVVSNVEANIGDGSGATGVVTVSGAGSQWTSSGVLRVGNSGSGTLTITNGGTVSTTIGRTIIGYNEGATGAVTVDGTGSHWNLSDSLFVGGRDSSTTSGGSGTLTITNGGTVSGTFGEIAINPIGTGSVTVSGTGSQWLNTNAIHVGLYGNGTLDILNGGYVSSLNARIGGNSFGDGTGTTGVATVSGAGSQWINSGYVYIGSDGNNGTLNITAGGYASNTAAYIGSVGSTGAVTVSGTGSQWINTDVLTVGNSGSGTLLVEDGGSVGAAQVVGMGACLSIAARCRPSQRTSISSLLPERGHSTCCPVAAPSIPTGSISAHPVPSPVQAP